MVAQSRHHSYPIQPRDLYILRERKSITIAIVITIYVLVTVTWKATCSYPILRRATAHSHYQPTSARRKWSGNRKAFSILRKDRGSEHIHQYSSIIFKYKDNRRTRNNKDDLGAILCAGGNSRSIEGQLVGWTIKGRVRGRDSREVIYENEEWIWRNSRGTKDRVAENSWAKCIDLGLKLWPQLVTIEREELNRIFHWISSTTYTNIP